MQNVFANYEVSDESWRRSTDVPRAEVRRNRHTVAVSWYQTFFDADYLRVFGPFVDGDRARQEALAIAGILGAAPGSVILDLACGQGRHAIPLRAAGFEVLGLDLSAVLLAAARARDGDLPVIRADMRILPLADASVDAVVNLFNAFGYFDDSGEADLGVLREVRRVLRPGGVFVQEVHHRDALVRSWEPRTVHPPYEDGLVVTEERDWDGVRGRHRVTYLLASPDAPPRRIDHSLRVYTVTELVALHEQAGLRVQQVNGDLVGTPLSPDTPLAVIVSRRD